MILKRLECADIYNISALKLFPQASRKNQYSGSAFQSPPLHVNILDITNKNKIFYFSSICYITRSPKLQQA